MTAHAAGVVFIAPDNNILVLLRSMSEPNYGGHWSLPGGKGEEGETPLETALREASEEIGDATEHAWLGEPTLINSVTTPTGMVFHTFTQPVRYKFVPELNAEHAGYAWAPLDALPRPLHPGVEATLKAKLGMDRSIEERLERLEARRTGTEDRGVGAGLDGFELAEDDFNESDHPRAENGKFGSGSGGGAAERRTVSATELHQKLRGMSVEKLKAALSNADVQESIKAEVKKELGARAGNKGPVAVADPHGSALGLVREFSDKYSTGKERKEALSKAPDDKLKRAHQAMTGHVDFQTKHMRDLIEAEAKSRNLTLDEDLSFGQDSLALDRESVRRIDDDGHLHVERTPITRANVSPYYGREIPDYQSFGLDPEKIYNLYRDQNELWKGASTFEGKPILAEHVPVSADDHPSEITVGAIGSPLEMEGDTLYAPLTFWTSDAIDGIDTGAKKSLSCGYRYRYDPTPGTSPDGTRYDGRMVDIVGNHLALVTEPRVPGSMVLDSNPQAWRGKFASDDSPTEAVMAKILLTRKAAVAQGALMTFLAPKLAQDAKIDLASILDGVTAKNFKAKHASIISGITSATTNKLAKDAKLDGLDTILIALDDVEPMETDPNSAVPAAKKAKDKKAKDEEPNKLKEFLKDKLSEDDMKACDALMDDDDEAAMDEDEEDDKVDKKAMDAAIKAVESSVSKRVAAEVRATEREIREAEKDCVTYVGDLAMTFDSAEGVYRHTLKMLNVEGADTIHVSALPAILKMQPKPGAKAVVTDRALSPDASVLAKAAELAPGFAHIKIGA